MGNLSALGRRRVRLVLILVLAALASTLFPSWVAAATRAYAPGGSGAGGVQQPPAETAGSYSASLEQCLSPLAPTGRAATFIGEMVATPTTARMRIKIELQERPGPGSRFAVVVAPGLGVWGTSSTGVGVYKNMRQVTNLAGAISYRALIHFQWLDSYGHVIKRAYKPTPVCLPSSNRTLPGLP
jgi:hypothetical protein